VDCASIRSRRPGIKTHSGAGCPQPDPGDDRSPSRARAGVRVSLTFQPVSSGGGRCAPGACLLALRPARLTLLRPSAGLNASETNETKCHKVIHLLQRGRESR
jgi:hypothetical protein